MFVAAPGHPALREICERIAKNANTRIDANSHLATLLRTGPGVFTDVVLKYAYLYPKSKVRRKVLGDDAVRFGHQAATAVAYTRQHRRHHCGRFLAAT